LKKILKKVNVKKAQSAMIELFFALFLDDKCFSLRENKLLK